MFKRFLVGLFILSSPVYGALITHTDYTSGNAITAAGQNSNENTIVNEINGNLDSDNIENGSLTTSDLSASAGITQSQMSTTFQSTMNYIHANNLAFQRYRRPELVWVSRSTVDISSNTGTSNQTCIYFSDEQRCVTENVLSTSVNRRAIITETASLSGTKNSGLRSGYVLTTNTWYSFYAVKVTDVSTDFVIVIDTITPSISNFSTLNTAFGTNGWTYLGVLPYGNWADNSNSLLEFNQKNMKTVFVSSMTGVNSSSAAFTTGIALSSGCISNALFRWTYASGISVSSHQIPEQLFLGDFILHVPVGGAIATNVLTVSQINNGTAGFNTDLFKGMTGVNTPVIIKFNNEPLAQSLQFTVGFTTCVGMIALSGYTDSALTGSYAPPF